MDSEAYRSTRAAWRRIWLQEADLLRELGTLDYPRSKEVRELYLPHLPREELILEAGCGLGIGLVHLARLAFRPVGLDYIEEALFRFNTAQPGHLLTAGDIHRLPYCGGAFAAYLSFGVLEHFDFGPLPALHEASRVLRNGGLLILTTPHPNFVRMLSRVKRRWIRRRSENLETYYETTYTFQQMEAFAVQAGFDVLERHPIGHSFTLWGLGWPFRASGYYRTTRLAEWAARWLRRLAPWRTCFAGLLIARKVDDASAD